MGAEVIVSCDCGIKEHFAIGGGMFNFTTSCLFPCYCKNCNNIISVNILSKNEKCPECNNNDLIPYDSNEMVGSVGTENVVTWDIESELGRVLQLTNGNYFCPKCEKFSLRFEDSGTCWD